MSAGSPAARASEPAPPRVSGSAYARASRLAIVAAGFSAVYLTVCGNQPITAVYFTNYLKASPELLGLLFGFIQAAGALQLLSVFIFRALPRRKPYFVAAHLAHRILGLALAASALLALGGLRGQEAARFALYGLMVSWSLWGLSTSGWLSWMADLVPEDVRGSFFLRRSAVYQTAVVIWFFLANVALDLTPEPRRGATYALIFGVGALGGIIEILLHLRIPEPPAQREEGPWGLREFLAPLRDANFLRYSLGIGLAVFAVFVGAPFQAPRITDPALIGAPNVWLGIMTVISILAWVAMAPLWGFVMDRYGRKPAVLLGCLLVGGWLVYFFVDHRNYAYLLPIAALVSGFFGPAFWEGSGQLMLTLAPPARRVAYIAWYNTILGLVSALGSPLGGHLVAAFPAGSLAALPGPLGGLEGFHLSQAAGLLAMGLALLLIRGVREGRERPVAGLLGQMASAGLFRTYASLLDLKRHSGDPRVARALRRIDGDEGELVLREVRERLDDPEGEVREEALRALGRIGSLEARLELEARLGESDAELRVEAARALGRLGDPAAVPALAAALRGADPLLRAACAGALARISGREAGGPLAELLGSECDPSVLEAAALGASSRCADEEELELLDAARELSARLLAARNRAARLQYAIGLANLLGRPGEFARLVTGDEELRAGRRRRLLAGLEERLALFFPEGRPGPIFSAEDLLALFDSGEGGKALALVLPLGKALVSRIFGDFATVEEPRLLARADARLAAWSLVALAAEAWMEAGGAHAPEGGEAALLLALVGCFYLAGS